MELQRRKELTEQMFHGMARIVDRFVVCDLENDHYEPCLAGSWIIWVKNKVLSAQTAPYFYGLHVQQAALLAGDLTEWKQVVSRIATRSKTCSIALVGKYVKLHDAYLSVMESLYHAGFENDSQVEIRWVESEDLTDQAACKEAFADVDGSTAAALAQNQLKVYDVLQNNDAYHALKAVDGLIITGATGTNVNDVAVVLIGNQG